MPAGRGRNTSFSLAIVGGKRMPSGLEQQGQSVFCVPYRQRSSQPVQPVGAVLKGYQCKAYAETYMLSRGCS